jgi:hypothetical protein
VLHRSYRSIQDLFHRSSCLRSFEYLKLFQQVYGIFTSNLDLISVLCFEMKPKTSCKLQNS